VGFRRTCAGSHGEPHVDGAFLEGKLELHQLQYRGREESICLSIAQLKLTGSPTSVCIELGLTYLSVLSKCKHLYHHILLLMDVCLSIVLYGYVRRTQQEGHEILPV